jgi:hypothetical protein
VARITNGRGFTDQDLKKKDFVNAKGELDCADDRVLELSTRSRDGCSTTDHHREAPRRPVPQAPLTPPAAGLRLSQSRLTGRPVPRS